MQVGEPHNGTLPMGEMVLIAAVHCFLLPNCISNHTDRCSLSPRDINCVLFICLYRNWQMTLNLIERLAESVQVGLRSCL